MSKVSIQCFNVLDQTRKKHNILCLVSMSQNTDTKHKAKSLDDNNCNKFHMRINISIYI